MNNAQKWLNSLTPEQRSEHCRRAGKRVKTRKTLFSDQTAAKEAGRRGGLATAKVRRNSVRH